MKNFTALVLFLSISMAALPQSQKVQVNLKNGSIVKGKLLETSISGDIKVESNNTTWVF